MLLSACHSTTDYFQSCDIDHEQWSPADSLFFPIHIAETSDVLAPVQYDHDYSITLSYRHSHRYPYQTLPVVFSVERSDSTGWQLLTAPLRVQLPTVDETGYPDDSGWGSLSQKEVLVSHRKLRFPQPGDYRIVICPDTLLSGVVSISVELD